MAASCLSTPLAPPRGAGRSPGVRADQGWSPRHGGRRPGPAGGVAGGGGSAIAAARGCSLAWLVAALVLAAALLAPEQPAAEAAICERHNGRAACRVW